MAALKIKHSNGAAVNSLLLMFVHVITTVLSMVVTKLLSVEFSLGEYGTYSQALLVTTTATSLSILGLTNATNYFYNRTQDEKEQRKYVSTVFAIQYAAGILCALLIVLARVPISKYFGNDRLPNVLLIVALTPLMTNLIAMYQTLFVSIGQAKKIAVRNFVVSALRLGAVCLACYVIKNIVTVLVIILILDVGQVLYFALAFKKDKYFIKVKDGSPKLIREILAFSIPMAVYVLTNSLSRDTDKYVISAFSNTETLAVYTNAAKVLPFDILTTSLITVLVPIITRYINQKDFGEAKNVFKLYLRIGYIMTCVFVGGAVAVARYLMLFLYDEKYMAGLSVFIVYLFVDMIRFANVTTVLSGSGNTKILMFVSVSGLVLNAVFNIITYKLWGMIGPAITTLVITFLMTLALLIAGARVIKTNVFRLFDFKEIALIGAEIIIFGTGAYFLSNYLHGLGMSLFFVLAISYGAYLLAVLGLNFKRILGCLKKLNSYK